MSFKAGRFILFTPAEKESYYITSWDTWEEVKAAFPIPDGMVLRDEETGREWHPGDELTAREWLPGCRLEDDART